MHFTNGLTVPCVRCINANACLEHLHAASVLDEAKTDNRPERSKWAKAECMLVSPSLSVSVSHTHKRRESSLKYHTVPVKQLPDILKKFEEHFLIRV